MPAYIEIWISMTAVLVASLGVIIALLEYRLRKRKAVERAVIQPLTSGRRFYEACEEIHRLFSEVRVLSKTPGLLLPSERDAASFRKRYFKTIYSRLEDGKRDYQLKYLFDTQGFIDTLKRYKANGNKSKIQKTTRMLVRALSYDNLDLRTTNTEPLMGVVIGGRNRAAVGFKDPSVCNITEGVLVKSLELLKVISHQFDMLFRNAKKVDKNLIDTLAKEEKI